MTIGVPAHHPLGGWPCGLPRYCVGPQVHCERLRECRPMRVRSHADLPEAESLVVLESAGARKRLRTELTCLRLRAGGRWTFGNALYAAGSYKGLANVKWTCNSPCVSRNYLIQVLLPAPPMQLPVRTSNLPCRGHLMPFMRA
jgi:hypothetical protein